jgi:hypothetical protein
MDRLSPEKGVRQMRKLPGIALILFLAACAGGPDEFPAADFSLKSPMTGQTTAFSAYAGRPVIIYWFTSW